MRRPSGSPITVIVLLALLVLPALYVLSVGPAHRLGVDGTIRIETVRTVYLPIIVLASAFPPVEHALGWYCGMWMRLGR